MIAATALALATLAASASAVEAFETEKNAAKTVKSLKRAVTALVGDCDLYDVGGYECEAKLDAAKKRLRDGDHYLYFGAPEPNFLRFHKMRGQKARLLWAPIIDARTGMAVTVGKPRGMGKVGPKVKIIPVDVELADGILEGDIRRAARLGQISVEVVGRFGPAWSVGRGDKSVRGVAFRPTMVRFSHARSGKVFGVATLK